jgi:hypothetical protein
VKSSTAVPQAEKGAGMLEEFGPGDAKKIGKIGFSNSSFREIG